MAQYGDDVVAGYYLPTSREGRLHLHTKPALQGIYTLYNLLNEIVHPCYHIYHIYLLVCLKKRHGIQHRKDTTSWTGVRCLQSRYIFTQAMKFLHTLSFNETTYDDFEERTSTLFLLYTSWIYNGS